MAIIQLPPPREIFLDFDGFLVDSHPLINASYRHAYEKMGLPRPSDEELKKNLKGSGLKSFPAIFGKKSDLAWEHYTKFYREHQFDPDIGVKPIEGAEEFLATLYAFNKLPIIATNKLGEFTEDEIQHFGWQDYIRFTVGSGDAGDGDMDKPNPALLHLAIRRLGSEPSPQDWMCGDTMTDALTAQNYGCVPIIVSKKIKHSVPGAYHFDSIEELTASTRMALTQTDHRLIL